jgi:putative transposase
LPLPPKSHELNPVEYVWQLKCDGWISNRIFKSLEDILGHCYFAWNKLIAMPWKIISIGIEDSDREISIDAAQCPERRHAQRWW